MSSVHELLEVHSNEVIIRVHDESDVPYLVSLALAEHTLDMIRCGGQCSRSHHQQREWSRQHHKYEQRRYATSRKTQYLPTLELPRNAFCGRFTAANACLSCNLKRFVRALPQLLNEYAMFASDERFLLTETSETSWFTHLWRDSWS